MKLRKSSLTICRSLIALVAFVAMAGSGLLVSSSSLAQGKKPPKNTITTPLISCAVGKTQTSLEIEICAPIGGTGLPAGFSLQWVELGDQNGDGNIDGADCAAFVWPASDDTGLCKASFSGNANDSRYNLAAGQCVTVNVGELLLDEGASTNCPDALRCFQENLQGVYVFRAFGHATNELKRSEFTGNLCCRTLPCGGGDDGGCTFTQGYWKTHGPEFCLTGNNSNEWPADVLANGLTLGTVNYTADQLCSILNTSGNGLRALAHQLIAAKLNVANGASVPSDVADCITAADALISGLVIPPVGSGSLAPSATGGLIDCLADYNEGATGPGHCGSESPSQ